MSDLYRTNMKDADIERAKTEALRFLNSVESLALKRLLISEHNKLPQEQRWRQKPPAMENVEIAAVRRASLDLTRALARMRTNR